jgi:hypothetical protein
MSSSPRNNHQGLTTLQRSRLVKSTRKLTKILGETPILQVKISSNQPCSPKEYLDNRVAAQIVYATKKIAHTILQIAHRQEVNNDNDSMRSSPSGLIAPDIPLNVFESERSWSPSLLYEEARWSPYEETHSLEADAGHGDTNASSRVSNANLSSKQQSSLISTPSKSLHSPTEWENWREEFEARSRRKRLSKLSRHLGETIPPDLILATPASLHDYVPPGVLASNAEPSTSSQETQLPVPLPPPISDISQPVVTNTTEIFESTRQIPSPRSVASIDTEPDHPFAQGHRRPSSEYRSDMQTRSDESFEVGRDEASFLDSLEDYKEQSVNVFSRPTSPLILPSLRRRNTSPSKRDAVLRRRERRQGWSGEWNAASMQDVISKLRDLR